MAIHVSRNAVPGQLPPSPGTAGIQLAKHLRPNQAQKQVLAPFPCTGRPQKASFLSELVLLRILPHIGWALQRIA